ncbi:MAG: hypothetical protein LBS32_07670 [Clostridiales Family XIII bacterium]|jgi:hypothetical protein|nr:hypothetical protein [Clostridiales Family XIII bacterium]
MDGGKVTAALDRADWISIGKSLVAGSGGMADVMPVIRLLDSLAKGGIQTGELDPRGGADMGRLQEKHGMALLDKTPSGTCLMCATAHDPEMPHNQQSRVYQYMFYGQYGRWPTWADAMAHCPQEIKDLWCATLAECGIEVGNITVGEKETEA